MKKKEKTYSGEKLPRGGWKEITQVIRGVKLPWILVAVSFVFTSVYNDLLLRLPDTTSKLTSGEMTGAALMQAIWYYVMFGIVTCSHTALIAIAKCLSTRNARNVVWDKMLRIRVDYYDKNDPMEQMSIVTNDLAEAIPNLVLLLITLLPDVYYVIRAFLQVTDYSGYLTIALLMFFPLKWLYMVVLGRKNMEIQAGLLDEIGRLTGYLAERVVNLSLIKVFTKEEYEQKNGQEASDRLLRANMRINKLSAVDSAVRTLLDLFQHVVVMIFAVILLQKGIITMKQWVAFFIFFESISVKYDTFIQDWVSIKGIQGSVLRTAGILMSPEETEGETGDGAFIDGDLVFDQVSFSYEGKPALKKVSFRVPQGTMAAIVGLCGSGKTTSLNLLERFYQPEEGEIRLGDRPVGKMALGAYREHFAYVQQNPDVFSGTVREALTYGIRREVTDEEIRKAAKASGFSDYLEEQPEGLETPVAPFGESMSGGQRQRLVLTREFLRGSEILLLDEPTSALDVVTAKAIKEEILALFDGKTVLIVTHDLKLLEGLDQIIVLKDGELMGSGTYEELFDSCELFHQMVNTLEKEAMA